MRAGGHERPAIRPPNRRGSGMIRSNGLGRRGRESGGEVAESVDHRSRRDDRLGSMRAAFSAPTLVPTIVVLIAGTQPVRSVRAAMPARMNAPPRVPPAPYTSPSWPVLGPVPFTAASPRSSRR